MEYFIILAISAVPASVAALLMKPNAIRYLIVAALTGFAFALLSIDLPSFIRQFHEISGNSGSIWTWVIWFMAFFIPSASITLLCELCIGCCRRLRNNKGLS